jgi:hypothetical protein
MVNLLFTTYYCFRFFIFYCLDLFLLGWCCRLRSRIMYIKVMFKGDRFLWCYVSDYFNVQHVQCTLLTCNQQKFCITYEFPYTWYMIRPSFYCRRFNLIFSCIKVLVYEVDFFADVSAPKNVTISLHLLHATSVFLLFKFRFNIFLYVLFHLRSSLLHWRVTNKNSV